MPERSLIIPINLPLPLPSPDSVNVYLIRAEPLTLVDTGLKSSSSLDALNRAMVRHGVNLKSIQRILITHGHVDHFGAAAELQRRSGAEVLVREEDLPKVTADYRLMSGDGNTLHQAGIPPKIIDAIEQVEKVMSSYGEPLDEVTPLTGCCNLEFDRFSLQALHLPGHSRGHAALFWPEKKTLISGDMVLPHITTIPVVEYTLSSDGEQRSLSLEQMIGSLKQLSELEIDRILPGHGAPVSDPVKLIASRIAFYEQRLEEIYTLLKSTGPRNPYQLALAYFQGIKGFDILLAVCEIIVNLDLLVHQGRAFEELAHGVSVFGARH